MEKLLDLTVITPLGSYPGKLRLFIDGENLSGILSVLGHDHHFQGGVIKNGKISLSMNVNTPLGMVSMSAAGTLSGEKLDAMANTRLGIFKLKSN